MEIVRPSSSFGSSAVGLPFSNTCPDSGRIRPIISFIIVDLPAPLEPISAIFSPLPICSEKSSKTLRRLAFDRAVFNSHVFKINDRMPGSDPSVPSACTPVLYSSDKARTHVFLHLHLPEGLLLFSQTASAGAARRPASAPLQLRPAAGKYCSPAVPPSARIASFAGRIHCTVPSFRSITFFTVFYNVIRMMLDHNDCLARIFHSVLSALRRSRLRGPDPAGRWVRPESGCPDLKPRFPARARRCFWPPESCHT